MTMSRVENADKQQDLAYQIQHAGDAIVNIDLDGRLTLVRQMVKLASGYQRHELLGQYFSTLVHPRYWDLMSGLRREGERDLRYHDRSRDRDCDQASGTGAPGDQAERSQTSRQDRGPTDHRSGHPRPEKTRADEIRVPGDRLPRAAHATDLDHGFCGLLLGEEPGKLTPTQREFLETALESSHNLLRTVNDILDVSRIEAGHLELRSQRVCLEKVVAREVRCARHLAESKNIALEMETVPHLPDIEGDPDRLGQVMDNLLSNAMKFTPRGGQVTVRVQLSVQRL